MSTDELYTSIGCIGKDDLKGQRVRFKGNSKYNQRPCLEYYVAFN